MDQVPSRVVTITAIILCNYWSPVLAEDHLQAGITNYNAGRYLSALHELNQAIQVNKRNALAHYYLANTQTYLGQTTDAIEQYKIAYKLSAPNSQIANYCMQALVGGNNQTDDQDPQQAISQMQAQLMQAKQNALNEAQAEVNQQQNMGNQRIKSIQDQANQEVEDIANNPLIYKRGRRIYFVPRTEEMDAVKQRAAADTQVINSQVQRATRDSMDISTLKQSALEDSANNLANQLSDPNSNLSSTGTNLYIRNYTYGQSSMDQNLPAPLMAKAKSLVFGNPKSDLAKIKTLKLPRLSTPLAAQPGSMCTRSDITDRTKNVHGKVIAP